MHRLKAEITELFSSFQGEGIFLGAKQIFVRFRQCNMACGYCDESLDIPHKEYTSVELIREIVVVDKDKGPHHSVSLTGGEPLLYADFLRIFLRLLKTEKFKVYLETNGTLPGELELVLNLVDIIAMDFKLPSSTGGQDCWREHVEFLKIASKKKVFVKAVITPDTDEKDIIKASEVMKKVNKDIPFILQPATPVKQGDKAVDKAVLMKFVDIWTHSGLDNIRVIPQMHKILDIK